MINYTEKGIGLHELIGEAGFSFSQVDGVWVSSDDTAVQLIIDSYDPLEDYKTTKKDEVKAEGLNRINIQFPAIQSVDEIKFYAEFWQSIAPAARQATTDFQKVIDIYTAAIAAISTINSYTLESEVNNYDPLIDPIWPS